MSLLKAIASAINRHSAENGSDTPDFILGEYLLGCLAVFDQAMKAREKWYGRESVPSDVQIEPPASDDVDNKIAEIDALRQTLESNQTLVCLTAPLQSPRCTMLAGEFVKVEAVDAGHWRVERAVWTNSLRMSNVIERVPNHQACFDWI